MKTKLIFVEHKDGTIPAWDRILEIYERGARGDKLYFELALYIRKGLTSLERTGVPDWKDADRYQLVDKTEHGYKITFNLLKQLKYNFPLMEFRINRRYSQANRVYQGIAFRMIFFTYTTPYMQYVFFTNAMIKTERSAKEFMPMIRQSMDIYNDFQMDKGKFIKE